MAALGGGLLKRKVPFKRGLLLGLTKPLRTYTERRADGEKTLQILTRYCAGEIELHDTLYESLLPYIRVFSPRMARWEEESFNYSELEQLLALALLTAIEPERCVGLEPERVYRRILAGLSRGSWNRWYRVKSFHAQTGHGDVRSWYSDRYYDSFDAADDALAFEQLIGSVPDRLARSSFFAGAFREALRAVAERLASGEPLPQPRELVAAHRLPSLESAARLVEHAVIRFRILALQIREENPEVSWEKEWRWHALFSFDITDWCGDPDAYYERKY